MWDARKKAVVTGLLARNSLVNIKQRNKFTAFDYDYKKLYEDWKSTEDIKEQSFWYLVAIIDTYFYILHAIQSAYALLPYITTRDKVEPKNFSHANRYDFECKYHLDNAITNTNTAFELIGIVLCLHLNCPNVENCESKIEFTKGAIGRVLVKVELNSKQKDVLSRFLAFYNSKIFKLLRDYRTKELHGHRNRLIVYLPRMNGKDLYHEDIFEIVTAGYNLFHLCYGVLLDILIEIPSPTKKVY